MGGELAGWAHFFDVDLGRDLDRVGDQDFVPENLRGQLVVGLVRARVIIKGQSEVPDVLRRDLSPAFCRVDSHDSAFFLDTVFVGQSFSLVGLETSWVFDFLGDQVRVFVLMNDHCQLLRFEFFKVRCLLQDLLLLLQVLFENFDA